MAFRMAALNKTRNGTWAARKVIPKDVRAEYQRLYGPAWEEKFSAPADLSKHEAKARCGEWIAEVETRISTIRAAARGEGIDLTQKQALALAGEWRAWFIAKHEDNPGEADRWWWLASNFHDDLVELAPAHFRDDPTTDPNWEWAQSDKVRPKVLALVADSGQTEQFLASRDL